MATNLDPARPIWRVSGRIPQPDGRRMTCFVNAELETDAVDSAKAEGIGRVESAWRVDSNGHPLGNVFHDHLDVCARCRERPFDLCAIGASALRREATR